MQQGSDGLSLEQALRVLRRRLPLVVLCVVVVTGATYAFSKHQATKYTATASLIFSSNPLSQQVTGIQSSGGGPSPAQQASNLELVRLGDMAVKTAALLGSGLTAERVIASLSISGQGESNTVDVSATAHPPALAAKIANTYTRQFVAEQQRDNQQFLRSALALINGQLARLSRQQRLGEDGLNLQNRAQTIRLLLGLKYGNVQIAEEALVPTSPSSPKTSRNTALGLLLGLLIGLGLAFVLERLDRRIKSSEDLEEIYRVPLLGVVPDSSALARSGRPGTGGGRALPPVDAEAFNLIRAHLRFFNVDHDLHTVVIASASPGDGKTTVALHLAEAAARTGSRVLLLEADLRRPTLAKQLDVPPGPGLTDVLIGSLPLEGAVRPINLDTPHGDGSTGRTLDVLTSGTSAPNPVELTESYAMGTLLARAKSTYDLVVIDTPPLTAVSDAYPLLTKVDGVVIVGWVARSRRDSAERLHQILDGSGAPVLGVIANGAKSGGPGSYADKSKPVVASGNETPAPEDLSSTAKV